MINITIGFLFYIAVVAFWTAFFGTVDSLPWGLDPILHAFVSQINIIISVLPPFATIWNVFVIGMIVAFALQIAEYTILALKLIRGGG